ncbi:hypothetical protein EDB87DRAFT_1640789 [Lactarius vividus]|nr:hypothetical protein EDB87DRAFT_1640789 [Lactarius vividus]
MNVGCTPQPDSLSTALTRTTTYITCTRRGCKLTSLGVLYEFTRNDHNTTVKKVEDVASAVLPVLNGEGANGCRELTDYFTTFIEHIHDANFTYIHVIEPGIDATTNGDVTDGLGCYPLHCGRWHGQCYCNQHDEVWRFSHPCTLLQSLLWA